MAKRMVILGSGESGVGAAILSRKQGYDVFVSDAGIIQDRYKTSWRSTILYLKKENIQKKKY